MIIIVVIISVDSDVHLLVRTADRRGTETSIVCRCAIFALSCGRQRNRVHIILLFGGEEKISGRVIIVM